MIRPSEPAFALSLRGVPDVERGDGSGYDLFVCALGFEPRCTHIFVTLEPATESVLVAAFRNRHVKGFHAASGIYDSAGVAVAEVSDVELAPVIRQRLEALAPMDRAIRIAVDVSSLSRVRTAIALEEVSEYSRSHEVCFDLLYAPAAFSPAGDPVSPLEVLEPVTQSYSGWLADPELPLVAVVGLGYEEQRGLGVIEYLEASEAWFLVPSGFDRRFDAKVEGANKVLLERVEGRRMDYDPSDPTTAFRTLQALAHSLRPHFRVVMVPMGPKIFAACCMMVSILGEGLEAVWRASSGDLEEPKSVKAAGTIVGLRFCSRPICDGND